MSRAVIKEEEEEEEDVHFLIELSTELTIFYREEVFNIYIYTYVDIFILTIEN